MKTILVILFLILIPCTKSYAASPFFQSFDSTDWTLLGATVLSDFGDFQTSASIPSLAEHGYAGYVEGNPLILRTFGTDLPAPMQYGLWFSGEFALQAASAYFLPPQWRDAIMGAFVGIGSIDVANNQLVHTYYGGNSLTVPFPDGGNSMKFGTDSYNGTDTMLWLGFASSQGILTASEMSDPSMRNVRPALMISTMETVGIVTLISFVLPEKWRDSLFGYEMGMSGAQMVLKSYRGKR